MVRKLGFKYWCSSRGKAGSKIDGTSETGIETQIGCQEGSIEARMRTRIGGPMVSISFVDAEGSGGQNSFDIFDGPLLEVREQGLKAIAKFMSGKFSEEEWLKLKRDQ